MDIHILDGASGNKPKPKAGKKSVIASIVVIDIIAVLVLAMVFLPGEGGPVFSAVFSGDLLSFPCIAVLASIGGTLMGAFWGAMGLFEQTENKSLAFSGLLMNMMILFFILFLALLEWSMPPGVL